MKVQDVMTPDPESCRAEDDVEIALAIMDTHECGAVPIVGEDGKLVGIVAQADLALRVEDDLLLADFLREISAAPADEPAPER